ncbi:hypothetical protein L596_022660 [Steinernema carpocapsae]|uniref:Uncharacterized protein n=1 Tax=Steinernema carpocapsae TaxID=34508 RepID=A0A4U5MMG2_STECR|nr:hypothetical protein L596_022660 [Steinernema carpocapsae]
MVPRLTYHGPVERSWDDYKIGLTGPHDLSEGFCGFGYEKRMDPFVKYARGVHLPLTRTERMSQNYKMHDLRSFQSPTDLKQWYAIFTLRDPKGVADFLNNVTDDVRGGEQCLLRKYRPDLNEMNDLFMLPAAGKELVVEASFIDGDEEKQEEEVEATTSTSTEDFAPDGGDENREDDQRSAGKQPKEEPTESEPDLACSAAPSILVLLVWLFGDVFT